MVGFLSGRFAPPVLQNTERESMVLCEASLAALEETAHLLRVPANAKRLLESLQQAKSGDRREHELAE